MKFIVQIIVMISIVCVSYGQQDQAQNLFRLAQAFEQQGDHERAHQLYSDLLRKDSNNFVYFDALRRTNIQLKRYDDAIAMSLHRFAMTPFDFTLQANIGSLLYQSGKESSADSVWNVVLSAAKKNQMVYRSVANEQVNQRLFYKAISTYVRGRRDIGDQYIFANELGYLYSFMMDYTNTTKEYLRLLRQNEQQYDFVQSRLAAIVSRPDALTSATQVVQEELRAQKTIPLMRLQMWLSMEAGRYQDAFTVAQSIEQSVSSGGQELFVFADRVFRENEFAVAAASYQLALKKGTKAPFIPAARFGYARCIEELSIRGDSVNAPVRQHTSTLESQPSFSGAINLYIDLVKDYPFTSIGGNSLYRIGMIRYKHLFDLDGALRVFDSVLTVSPTGPIVPTVLSTKGEIFVAQNKLNDASKTYQQMNASPYANQEQRSLAQFRLAELQFFRQNFDSTLALLKPLTENLKADESNDALLLQYFVTENMFQYPSALRQFADAELLARQQKLSEAITEFHALIDLYPAAPLADDVLLKIADYSIMLKKYQDALSSYTKLLQEYKESIEKDRTYFKIGELYQYHLIDKQKAIDSYETILEKFPLSLFAEEARKRIRLLRGDSI